MRRRKPLAMLLLVLAVVGNDPFERKVELSQDRYEWLLNKGDILTQDFKGTDQGTNLIRGKYRSSEEPDGVVVFEVLFASLEGREERFRELKSREYVTTSSTAFAMYGISFATATGTVWSSAERRSSNAGIPSVSRSIVRGFRCSVARRANSSNFGGRSMALRPSVVQKPPTKQIRCATTKNC